MLANINAVVFRIVNIVVSVFASFMAYGCFYLVTHYSPEVSMGDISFTVVVGIFCVAAAPYSALIGLGIIREDSPIAVA